MSYGSSGTGKGCSYKTASRLQTATKRLRHPDRNLQVPFQVAEGPGATTRAHGDPWHPRALSFPLGADARAGHPTGPQRPCLWHCRLLHARGLAEGLSPTTGAEPLGRGWTYKQEIIACKKAAIIATQMPPVSSRDIDEVTDGCAEECGIILVVLRWLLQFGVPVCGVICSARLWGAPCQLDADCMRMSPTWPGDIPVPPSLEMHVLGKATRDHYIHFWGQRRKGPFPHM